MLGQSISKNALLLLVFALTATGLITLTHWLTKDKIQSEKELALKRLINQVVEPKLIDNDVYHDCIRVENDELIATSEAAEIYRTRLSGEPTAAIFKVTTAEGYSGGIVIVVSVLEASNEIGGVRVLEHKETPGLGDKIEHQKSPWVEQFKSESLAKTPLEQWKVKKDQGKFDAITGATVTPRAVVKVLRQVMLYWDTHKTALFERNANCRSET